MIYKSIRILLFPIESEYIIFHRKFHLIIVNNTNYGECDVYLPVAIVSKVADTLHPSSDNPIYIYIYNNLSGKIPSQALLLCFPECLHSI